VSFVVRSLHARALRAPLRNRTWLARGGAFTAPLASQRSVPISRPARSSPNERAAVLLPHRHYRSSVTFQYGRHSCGTCRPSILTVTVGR